jgi:hypothetical protein
MNLLTQIQELYAELPQVACEQCGRCCVSPTCTLAEFIYLVHYCCDNLPAADFEKFIFAAPRMSETCEGNLVCAFLQDKLCGVHLWRTGACRLFGIPILESLGVSDLVSCYNNIRVVSGESDEAFVSMWLGKLTHLNDTLYPFGKAPYHVYGLNLESWLDVYFDALITVDVFLDIREKMGRYFDLSQYKSRYIPKTGIKDKIDKISILFLLIDSGDKATIRELLVSIRDDYPLTGTYFRKEAETFLAALDD